MKAEELSAIWGKEIVRFPRRAAAAAPIGNATRDFLTEVGLPHSAAPFLSFGRVYSADSDSEVYLPSMRVAFGLDDPEFDRFILIGSDGSDDPLAIDRETDEVVWLVEEEEGGVVRFVNVDVESLARCLVVYREFVGKVTQGDEMAFLENRFDEASIDWLEAALRQADARALSEGAMWAIEIQSLRAAAAETD